MGAGARCVNASMWMRRRGIIGVDWTVQEEKEASLDDPSKLVFHLARAHGWDRAHPRQGVGQGNGEVATINVTRMVWQWPDRMACRRVSNGYTLYTYSSLLVGGWQADEIQTKISITCIDFGFQTRFLHWQRRSNIYRVSWMGYSAIPNVCYRSFCSHDEP